MKNIHILITTFATLFMMACDDTEQQAKSGSVDLIFDLTAGDEDLSFGTSTYENAAGNEFSVNTFWMYVSNIQLKGAEGTDDYLLEPRYFLVEENADVSKVSIEMLEVPAGNYMGIEYAIGVDEPANTDISAVEGDLDPARAWNWDSGYKFLTLEGVFYPFDAESRGLVMHIGLNQNYKMLSFPFTEGLKVDGNTSVLDFKVDILKLFSGQHTIDFNQTNTIKAQPVESAFVADNYANGMIQLMK